MRKPFQNGRILPVAFFQSNHKETRVFRNGCTEEKKEDLLKLRTQFRFKKRRKKGRTKFGKEKKEKVASFQNKLKINKGKVRFNVFF